MREISIMCGLLMIPHVSHAQGMMGFIQPAIQHNPIIGVVIALVLSIVALAIIGVAGSALLSAFGSGQAAALVKSGTQLGCLVVFLCICVIAVNEFSNLISG